MSDTLPNPMTERVDSLDASLVTVYTTSWCGECRLVKNLLNNHGIAFHEVNIEHDPQAAEYVVAVNNGKRSVPTLVYKEQAMSLSQFSPAKFEAFLEGYSAQQQSS